MMGLFGDILPPVETRVEQTLRRNLELRRKQRPERWTGYAYQGAADLLLREGKFYPARETPDVYKHLRGAPNECFSNAVYAVTADPSLRYCEGVYNTGFGESVTHGWCIAPDGGVVELTFPTDPEILKISFHGRTGMPLMPLEHWAYWGVTYHIELAAKAMETIGLPLLDRSGGELRENVGSPWDMTESHDYPILKLPYDPNRKDLP